MLWRFFEFCGNIFSRKRVERELDEEIHSYLELMAAEVREQEREPAEEPEEITPEMARESADARRALETLPERDRQALLMKGEGLDYGEIAEVLGIEKGSVGTTLSRARRRLAETYEALQDERRRREQHAAS